MPIIKAQGDVSVMGLCVSVDRMERGQGEKSALVEISEKYGFKTTAIVTMQDVVEHLYNNPINGKVIIDDELKGRIDAYYEEYPVHTVTVSSFYIGKTEVTQELWVAIMGYNQSYFKKGGNYPVESVSWDDIQEFLKKLIIKLF